MNIIGYRLYCFKFLNDMMERWINERGFFFLFNFELRDVEKKGVVRGGVYIFNFLVNVNIMRVVKKEECLCFYYFLFL